MTLKEYAEDYASPETKRLALEMIEKEVQTIPNDKVREIALKNLHGLDFAGLRDFCLTSVCVWITAGAQPRYGLDLSVGGFL